MVAVFGNSLFVFGIFVSIFRFLFSDRDWQAADAIKLLLAPHANSPCLCIITGRQSHDSFPKILERQSAVIFGVGISQEVFERLLQPNKSSQIRSPFCLVLLFAQDCCSSSYPRTCE